MAKPPDWDKVSAYFRENAGNWADPAIDDRTWSDLDMADVMVFLDRTRSSVGRAVFYAMLRRPLFDPEAWHERARTIAALAQDARARARIDRVTRRLGMEIEGEVFRFIAWLRTQVEDRRRHLYRALSILPILAVPAAIFLGAPGIAALAALAVLNLVIHYRLKPVVAAETPSYQYLHRILVAAGRLGRLDLPPLRRELGDLASLERSLRRLRRRTAFLATPPGFSGDVRELFAGFIRQFLLLEVTAYYAAHNEIIARMADLTRLTTLVGTVDALAGVADLRAATPGLVEPEIQAGGLVLDGEDLVHPLLPHPVANSTRMDGRGILVTGSNMSGKSTFLRTLGVNLLLGTTICLAFGRRLRLTPLLAVTSITNRDNILAAESHYLVEAKRLLVLLEAARRAPPAFLIVDEILAGTNSEERIAASVRILRHLAGLPCLVAAATHDRPIAAALADAYDNLHFTHLVDGEELEFDYRLRRGIVESGNALRLLRLLGYPPQILEDGSP